MDRGVLAILSDSYHEESLENGSTRTVLKLKKHLAPVKFAVIPIARNNEQIMKVAQELAHELRTTLQAKVVLENTGNIGKAYRRHDEIGTPFCITVDFDTIGADDATHPHCVTIRDRDTMAQSHIPLSKVCELAPSLLKSDAVIDELLTV